VAATRRARAGSRQARPANELEAAREAARGLDDELLSPVAERPLDVLEMTGDVALRYSHELREIESVGRPLEECVPDALADRLLAGGPASSGHDVET
jgi:hypothetical protein